MKNNKWVNKSAWCKKYKDFGGNNFFYKKGTPPLFIKPSGLASGTSVRGTARLILVRIIFNYLNFYSIEMI